MLFTIFNEIPDQRRAQGRRYKLAPVLFLSVLAILSGADSYREIETFITIHFKKLKKKFRIRWERPPSYTTIREIIQGVNSQELEKAFRKYAEKISEFDLNKYAFVSLDGKTIRGSFNNFHDKKAIQIFSAFLTGQNIILAHENIEGRKTNEIPMAQKLIKELNLQGCIFTADAMHCQKKL